MNDVPGEAAHVRIIQVGARLARPKETNVMEVEGDMRGISDDDDSIGEEDGFVTSNLIHDGGIEVSTNFITF